MKPKLCKVCKEPFTPHSTTQRVCSPKCAIEQVKSDREKAERKKTSIRKVELRSRRDWLKLAQNSFNFFVRKRDRNKLCICCDKPLTLDAIGGGYDCGHYRSVGSAPHLRFDPRNAHGQRKQCNKWGSGRAVDYRIGLIRRIGLTEAESLESDQTICKYTINDLEEIIKKYKQLAKELP